MHAKTILLLISFFIFSSLFFSSGQSPFSEKLRAFADISVQELINFTNQKRAENGLPTLSSNTALNSAASKKAEDMFAKNYWAHNSPDGTTPWVFIKQAGYNYVYAGENLAKGFNSATDVVNAWMASSTHRENILSPNFKDVGFAVKSGSLNGEQTFLVVQEFGSRNILPLAKQNTPKKQNTKKVLGFEISSYLANKPNLSASSNFVIILIAIFISVFFLDMIVIRRKNIARFVGHNLDHAIFLSAIVIVIAIFNTGAVL
ncbi:MAG: hypothetical protein HY426_03555 [Candidatus Levybacteria bacterium]|nr:hypothetical protein [Candidatus Levybacteria bacterium]